MSILVVVAGQRRTWDITSRDITDMFKIMSAEVRYVFLSPDNDLFSAEGPSVTVGQYSFSVPYHKINYPSSCPDKVKAIKDQWSTLLEAYAHCILEDVEWIVRIRPDLKVLVPFEDIPMLSPDALYFPEHNNWGGLNDRFWFGPKHLMLQSFKYFESAAKLLTKNLNLERLLGRHLVLEKKIPIKRTCAVMTPLRADGRYDPVIYRIDRGDRRPKDETLLSAR